METSTPYPSYLFFIREDQGNVIYSSNNITAVENPQVASIQEPRYITEGVSNRQYVSPEVHEENSEGSENGPQRKRKPQQETFWDKDKIKTLLTLCLENSNVDKDTLWEDIGSHLGATPEDCKKKYWHLRRTYLRLLKKKKSGKDIKWIHYGTCERVFTDLHALPPSVLEPWDDNKTKRMLNLYIENIPKFNNPSFLHKDVWRDIAAALGSTGYNCYHKFKNLKRSYWHWISRSQETGKTMKWPFYHYFERINCDYRPRTPWSWDRHKINLLLEAYRQIAHKFRNPKCQKKDLWKEISRQVGESPAMCDKKFRNLKQTFLRLRMKANTGRLTTKWRYYRDFETLYGNVTRFIEMDGTQRIVLRAFQDEDYIKQLLTFYLQNKDKFRDPLSKKKPLWKMIAPKVGLTAEECDKKFRNLKQTYIRLAWKKKTTGKEIKWSYFPYFEKIYNDSVLRGVENTNLNNIDDIMKYEIRRVVEDVQEKTGNDAKFERLLEAVQESNDLQRERNQILRALLNRK